MHSLMSRQVWPLLSATSSTYPASQEHCRSEMKHTDTNKPMDGTFSDCLSEAGLGKIHVCLFSQSVLYTCPTLSISTCNDALPDRFLRSWCRMNRTCHHGLRGTPISSPDKLQTGKQLAKQQRLRYIYRGIARNASLSCRCAMFVEELLLPSKTTGRTKTQLTFRS